MGVEYEVKFRATVALQQTIRQKSRRKVQVQDYLQGKL